MTIVKITEARSSLGDLFNKVLYQHDRIVIDRRGKDKVALVPIEDLRRLEELEDREDIAAADAALAETDERIPYDEIRRELGL